MCRGLVSYVLIDIVYPCCLQHECVQVIRNLNRHSLSPKSKSGHKNYFCCCIKLTHIRKVVFNTFLKGIYCKYTWTRIFSLSFVFGNHVSHALADIVTSNQNQNQSYNSAISNSFALIIWSYMKYQQFNEKYPTMVGQTRITCCRDLDFPFPTIVVHESPFSTTEQNTTMKEGETTKSRGKVIAGTHCWSQFYWSVTEYKQMQLANHAALMEMMTLLIKEQEPPTITITLQSNDVLYLQLCNDKRKVWPVFFRSEPSRRPGVGACSGLLRPGTRTDLLSPEPWQWLENSIII